MSTQPRIIPVYTSRGDVGAFMIFPYLFNQQGEWIGWVAQDRKVYTVYGQYVGYMADGPRVLRKLSDGYDQPRRTPPQRPPRVHAPAMAPLPPMMSELPSGVIDVLGERPELLGTLDAAEREDMD